MCKNEHNPDIETASIRQGFLCAHLVITVYLPTLNLAQVTIDLISVIIDYFEFSTILCMLYSAYSFVCM